MTTLLALDGNSLAHRAYHAYAASNMTNSAGRPVFATYGFLALFNGIIEKVTPDSVIVAFDDPDHNERKVAWPSYKAQREEKSSDLTDQLEDIRAALDAMGVQVVVAPGWEADDVVASAAAAAEARGWKTVVATSDRDAFALISADTTVLRLVSGLDNAVEMTPAALVDKYGIAPHQYLDFAALRGDKSDNLPGVTGVGEKTAAKLLARMGTVEAALADTDATVAAIGSFARRLFDGADAWRTNVAVMALRRDLDVDLDACTLEHISGDVVARTLHAYELPNLVARLGPTLTGRRRRADRPGRGAPVGTGHRTTGQVPPQAPPPAEPPADVPAGMPHRSTGRFDVAGVRGVGRGLPAAEDSTPTVTVTGRRIATTGGATAPATMPTTLR